MKDISEGAVEYGSNHQRASRGQQPSIGHEDAVLLQRTQHVAPARHRLIHSQAEEGERYFGGDISRNQQGRLGQEQAEDFGQKVPPQQVEVRAAKAACR